MKKLEKELKPQELYKVPSARPKKSPFFFEGDQRTVLDETVLTYSSLLKHSTVCLCLCQNEQYQMKLQKSKERRLALIKSSLDIVVAVGCCSWPRRRWPPASPGRSASPAHWSLATRYQSTSPAPRSLFGATHRRTGSWSLISSDSLALLGSCFRAHPRASDTICSWGQLVPPSPTDGIDDDK